MNISDTRRSLSHIPTPKALSRTQKDRLLPIAYAGGMLVAGALLLVTKPRIGHVPDPKPMGDLPTRKRWKRAAQYSRDSVEVFAPTNITDSIGRSLLIGGTALLLTRLLDELVGRK